MACKTAKSMTFRVYNIKIIPEFIEAYRRDWRTIDYSNPQLHTDTGKEFTIENHPNGISYTSIPTVMLQKIYSFSERINGWGVEWTRNKEFIEGHIAATWYIKRVL